MTVQFPDPAQWIPDTNRLNVVGEGLLEVAYGALNLYDLGSRYERRYVGHGTEAPVVPSRQQQLTVVCTKLFVGRAGEEAFQFAKGEPGKFAYQTATFMLELTAPWPRQQSTQTVIRGADIDDARAPLWREGLVVWAAMIGLALGAVSRPWPETTVRGDGIAVGPLSPRDPLGGQASWTCLVNVEI